MNYTFRYLNPSEFSRRNQEFCRTNNIKISAETAKEVGIICLRVIQIYQETKSSISSEKSNLKIWVREQRSSARNHGRIIKYKGASRTRSSINASVSNVNDQVLNRIDSMLSTIDSNLNLAKQRLNSCLVYTTIEDIKSYEATYLEEQEQLKQHNSLKELRIALYLSMGAVPILTILFTASAEINWVLSTLIVIAISVIWGVIAFYSIKYLTQRIKRYENAKSSIQDLKMKKTLEAQDSADFLLKLNSESAESYLAETQEPDPLETQVISELANKLKEEYVLLENACLHFDLNANTWLDLAEKIHNDTDPPDDDDSYPAQLRIQDNVDTPTQYTVDDLKARFSTFQEAKEFYGISAKGWQALVDKLNNQ